MKLTAQDSWLSRHAVQLSLIPMALGLSIAAHGSNVLVDEDGRALDVVLTPVGALAWAASVAAWIMVLGLHHRGRQEQSARAVGHGLRRWIPRVDAPLVAVVVSTLFGLWFRARHLPLVPPEMTSDHIEMLLDALRVGEGHFPVFFANNGGREAFQMYLVALVAQGLGFEFAALKWATVVEGVITIPLVFWMARQVIGERTRRERELGRWVGAAAAALIAVSSWHLMLSRLGLRIVLTPLTTALAIGFLARGMRHGLLRDYLALGATVGAGFYLYQANRALPLLVVMGVAVVAGRTRGARDVILAGLAALAPVALAASVLPRGPDFLPLLAAPWFTVVALRLRAAPDARPARQHLGGLLAATVVTLAICVPMHHYSRLHPEAFWNRTDGRIFGEPGLRGSPSEGSGLVTPGSLSGRAAKLWSHRRTLLDNGLDAVGMFHLRGDVAWINNADSRPALDPAAGALLLLGVFVWAGWSLRRRDPVWWLIPLALAVLLLPSVLALAHPVENPSFTRASGVIPVVFLLAGLPLGWLLWRVSREARGPEGLPWGSLAALGLLAAVVLGSYPSNRDNFFIHYRRSYQRNWPPYSEIAKPLRDFAEGDGTLGNAFVVAYPHWLDHRILGAAAGDLRWPNGLRHPTELPAAIARKAGTSFAYDPGKPLFVMYHEADHETGRYLRELHSGVEARSHSYQHLDGADLAVRGRFKTSTIQPR